MPTKTSKTKRVKGGKGKKDGKHESKGDKESDVETARANAALWELRLKATNQDLAEYREASHNLARANEGLINQLLHAERDSVDVSGHWEREMAAKEEKIRMLEESLQRHQALSLEEKNNMTTDINTIQDKVKRLKEREVQLEQELGNMKESMDVADKKHKETLIEMEEKFLEEKECVKREILERCNLQEVLLKQDHREAIEQLEGVLHAALEKRDHLNEILKNTTKEAEDLKTLTHSLVEENIILAQNKEMLQMTVKKNQADIEHKNQKLSELTVRIASLEEALDLKSRELQQLEKKEQKNLVTIQAKQVEMDKLQRVLAMRVREMQDLKQLASTVVKKRKEMEEFFYEALDHVRQEIAASRFRYKKESKQAYSWRFREATAGKMEFPPICTNHIYTDMEPSTKCSHLLENDVQVSDLTWEQKEQVLRLLFAKMNGQTERKQHSSPRRSVEMQNSFNDKDAAE
ncbi:Basal body-orientation factor 1 [Oryzias melastigma]|nr:basal body-orientation factor 1 [Oryzias melastigma]KAF6718702.1 Basal body-orientation factor 1 [Oryzias melastigma]